MHLTINPKIKLKPTNWIFILFLLVNVCSFAQANLPIPRNIAKTYQKSTRSTTGAPGTAYWQNTADYDIHAAYNPANLLLQGSETIIYTNNSPDTLTEILLKLYPNFYKKGSMTLWKIAAEDVGEGMSIESIAIGGNQTIAYTIDGTNMVVKMPPLYPKQNLELKLAFHYTLNKGSHNRTGQVDPNSAFVAYFFPRVAVYDDVDGWNKHQYIGTQEFYNDFCHFKAAITVPKDFVVWATGDLKNCDEVLQNKYCRRLQQAFASNSPVVIIDSTDLAMGNVTIGNDEKTWLYEASNVTDFVFGTSNHYVWHSASTIVDSTTNRRTRADAVFNPKHRDYHDVLHYTLASVKAMSFVFPKWPFPYPHITVFDGLDQMEYPMMVNDLPLERFDAITTTDHEVFHTIFPFYMGINETKYSWMDEGWATMGEWLISPIIDSTIADDYGMRRYDSTAGYEEDLPITTLSTQLNGNAFFLNSYVKPALGYLYVRDYLGNELFTRALHNYISNWHGKHPMPHDFFNSMNTGCGRNLDWFWKQWFFESGYPDLAISRVKKTGNTYMLTIENKGNKPVPIDLTMTLDDGTTQQQHRTIGIWESGNKTANVTFVTNKKYTKIVLGSLYTADVNKANNEVLNKD